MGEFAVLRRVLPLLALVLVASACRPTGETAKNPPVVPEVVASELPSPLDPEGPREVVLGKRFSADGSIPKADRATSFAPDTPILLAIESGDLLEGTRVTATWTPPDGSPLEQELTVIGGETYLTFTAPSATWTPGTGQVSVRIGGEPEATGSPIDLPFKILP